MYSRQGQEKEILKVTGQLTAYVQLGRIAGVGIYICSHKKFNAYKVGRRGGRGWGKEGRRQRGEGEEEAGKKRGVGGRRE